MDYRIKEVLRVMEELNEVFKRTPLPKGDSDAIKEGLSLSKRVCSQEKFVFPTPLMKNLLVWLGDCKQYEENGEIHTDKLPAGKESKAVKYVNDLVHTLLEKYNGRQVDRYDYSLPIDSRQNYNTDCWLGWKPEIWDIVPGQEEKLREGFPTYSEKATTFTYEDMVKAIQTDQALQKAILFVLEDLPEVKASSKVTAVSEPFMSKKTGVSYPFYRNDSTIYKGNVTYGQHCINLVQQSYNKRGIAGLKDVAFSNNVVSGYARRQRGKARALRAQSRLTNLVVNMINGPEIEKWKSRVMGFGFSDTPTIKEGLCKMAQFCIDHPEYGIFNDDFTSFDSTVGYGWQCLQNALRYMRANGTLSKELVKIRHVCGTKALFVDGLNNRTYPIYGRQMSGYDDTTTGNTTVCRLLTLAACLSTDPKYAEKVSYPMKGENLFELGDDTTYILKKKLHQLWIEYVKRRKFDPHDDAKAIYGPMFIQWRVYREDGKNWVMGYNWPRVLRSMLSKENAKNLGKAGWTLSFYQQIEKCLEIKDALTILVNLAAAFDKDHLMLDVPIEEIKKMVQQEDNMRKTKGKSRKSDLTTAERLATNPQNGSSFIGGSTQSNNLEIDYDHFGKLQTAYREVYDPNFLPKHGIVKPDLSKVR